MTEFEADPVSYLAGVGIHHARLLPTGEWAGVQHMMFTVGLMLGCDAFSYRTRFCYATFDEALAALNAWDGNGWPPGYWQKQKPEDVHGPGSTDRFATKVPLAPPTGIEPYDLRSQNPLSYR